MDRDDRIVKAIEVLKQRHWEQYGFDTVNEFYVRSLSSRELDLIIESRTSEG